MCASLRILFDECILQSCLRIENKQRVNVLKKLESGRSIRELAAELVSTLLKVQSAVEDIQIKEKEQAKQKSMTDFFIKIN